MKLPSGATARSVEEWIGKTPDTPIPDRVKIRVFARFKGKCGITGKRLRAGEYDIDHILALKDEGENRESNLWPVWREKHREKTAQEKTIRAKVEALQKKQLPKPQSKWQKQPFNRPRFDNTKYIGKDT